MGSAGQAVPGGIMWRKTIKALLSPFTNARTLRTAAGRRPQLTVGTTFPIFPPRGGGQSRVFFLYRQLARAFDIDVVCLTGTDDVASKRLVAPGLWEIRVPASPAHARAEAALTQEVGGIPITDVLMPELINLTPEYERTFAALAAGASAVVACHPYLLPAIRRVSHAPLWYEAQDVETTLKQTILPDTPLGRRLIESTRAVEQAACDEAVLVFTCSREDATTLERDFSTDPNKLVVVPNGVDLETVTYSSPTQRAELRRRLGIEGTFQTLFVGSWHQPNIEAVEDILPMAARFPDVRFLVLGSIGMYFGGRCTPRNVGFMGVVDDETKNVALSCADCALNPMRSGSGTNLKMLDYFASGVPVISTLHGVRGLGAEAGKHLVIAEIESFPDAIAALRDTVADGRTRPQVEAARALAEEVYDWRAIADRFLCDLDRRAARIRATTGGDASH